MTTESDHLATPVRHEERGLALWVGLALGFAGVIVTIGGLYEWNQRKAGHQRPATMSAPARPAAVPDRLPGEDAEIVRLRQQLEAERRSRILAESQAFQRQQQEANSRPRRCIDGVRFEQFGQEWRNVGRC